MTKVYLMIFYIAVTAISSGVLTKALFEGLGFIAALGTAGSVTGLMCFIMLVAEEE